MTRRLEETGGLEDDNPDFGPDPEPEPEPEDYCRARTGLCHADGTCDKCGAIEGEHCREDRRP
jgi:hypothetical protein